MTLFFDDQLFLKSMNINIIRHFLPLSVYLHKGREGSNWVLHVLLIGGGGGAEFAPPTVIIV